MPIYYHTISPAYEKKAIANGLKPGKELGIQNIVGRTPVDNNYVYLWKNYNILKGKLFSGFVDSGWSLLKVEIPASHPVERDLDVSVLFQEYPDLFLPMIKLLEIDFAPRRYLSEKKLHKLARSIGATSREGQIRELAELVIGELVKDKDALQSILTLPTDEKWDEIIGSYRTKKSILPGPHTRIELYASRFMDDL